MLQTGSLNVRRAGAAGLPICTGPGGGLSPLEFGFKGLQLLSGLLPVALPGEFAIAPQVLPEDFQRGVGDGSS